MNGSPKWTFEAASSLFEEPFSDLLLKAQTVHREMFDPNEMEAASLLSIKTGGCPEDCGYCSQSARYQTGVKATSLMSGDEVIAAARAAKDLGATRFCMAAAWRNPKDRDLGRVCEMTKAVKGLGLETCATLGMLTPPQAERLSDAGLDFYNHNIDTSREYYPNIATTRTIDERLETLEHARRAGLKVCCGGIVGMGESPADRLGMLVLLANLPEPPESLPLNLWHEVEGVPVKSTAVRPDPISIARLVATARIMMPTSVVRLSAGRKYMTDEMQALCFFAGANSIFIGDVLLTTSNPQKDRDTSLLSRLGIRTRGDRAVRREANATDAAL
jgi:biotin synthase